MGHRFFITSASFVALIFMFSAATILVEDRPAQPVAFVAARDVHPEIKPSAPIQLGSSGSALATAAFGLSALQPETFNGQIVKDIIEASPLAYGEKDRLTAKLFAAEAGRAELPEVLADIRVSLAVE